MKLHDMLVTDQQVAIHLYTSSKGHCVSYKEKNYRFSTIDKVQEFFFNQGFDTIEITQGGAKSYHHHFDGEVEIFSTKKALRRQLSQDGSGAWAERRGDKTRYLIEEGGLSSPFKKVTKKECLQKVESPSTLSKAAAISLGVLALLPGTIEMARQLPFGAYEAGIGFVALQQRSPLLEVAMGCAILPSKVSAQAPSTEFLVNTYSTNEQSNANIATLADGGFVVTWQTDGVSDNVDVEGQTYDSSGAKISTEFQVNTYWSGRQGGPSVAALADGGFVVIWSSDGQDGDLYGIYGQMLDNSGAKIGDEFQVNTYTTSSQANPSVAALADGGFVVTWDSNGQDGYGWTSRRGVFGQRYDSSGAKSGAEFQVNTNTLFDQKFSSVAALPDGGFVVTWQSDSQEGDSYGVFGQRYDSSGAKSGAEFQVNTYTANNQDHPSVAVLVDGGFVVTWQSDGQDGDLEGVYGQRYDSSGAKSGAEFRVNTYTVSSQEYPSVAALVDGGFVVIWQSDGQDGSDYGIYGQRYDSSGAKSGDEFQVNTYWTGEQAGSSVAALPDGGFVVTWRSYDGDSFGIIGQRYDSSGNPIALQVHTSTRSMPMTTLISADEIVYGASYQILVDGQVVGSYTVSEEAGNPSAILLTFDSAFQAEPEQIITLFTIPSGQEGLWEGIEVQGQSSECSVAYGQVSSSSYQISFRESGCGNSGSHLATTFLLTQIN